MLCCASGVGTLTVAVESGDLFEGVIWKNYNLTVFGEQVRRALVVVGAIVVVGWFGFLVVVLMIRRSKWRFRIRIGM